MQSEQAYQLLDALKEGDESGFKKVFDLYYRQLVITSYQILKDEHICRDAVQEVFVELWKNRDRLHHKIDLLPYLKRSVLNRSINILKSRRHHMSSGESPLQAFKDSTRTPLEQYEDNELKEVVLKAIDQMPDRCRAVFMLRRMEGWSHAEISKELSISTKTIENQMTKALKIIRNALHQYKTVLSLLFGIFLLYQWGIFEIHLLSN